MQQKNASTVGARTALIRCSVQVAVRLASDRSNTQHRLLQPVILRLLFPQAPVEQVSPAVRIIYFFLFGYIAGLCLLVLAVVFMLTIIGYPLGRALLRMLPAVWTLQREREPLSYTLGQGRRATLAKYQAAPLWGKVLAPLALAVYAGAIIWYVAG